MQNSKPNILYVDDEPINLRVFQKTFKKDFHVFIAESGEEGLELLQNNEIDLIITDQRMPKMTGVQFLEKVIKRFPEPNRILLTAYTDFDAITQAVNKGKIFQFIQKPWKKHEIKPVLDYAIEILYLKKENQHLNKELREALNRANESEKLKTAFLANLSHEIRTPLNGIVGFSGLLEDEDLTHKERCNFIKTINTNVENLLSIINDIIEISIIETGKLKLSKETFNLNELFDEIYHTFKEEQVEKIKDNINFKLIKNSDDTNFQMTSDKVRLKQVIKYLLDNAFKFTEKGEIQFGYEIITHEQINFFVKDTGIGISPENQKNIFKSFQQEDNSLARQYTGVGIGLTISANIVELFGGKIEVESQKNKGSNFSFIIFK